MAYVKEEKATKKAQPHNSRHTAAAEIVDRDSSSRAGTHLVALTR